MEDFDEAEEMNEEDLISLGDEFAKIDLVPSGYFYPELYGSTKSGKALFSKITKT